MQSAARQPGGALPAHTLSAQEKSAVSSDFTSVTMPVCLFLLLHMVTLVAAKKVMKNCKTPLSCAPPQQPLSLMSLSLVTCSFFEPARSAAQSFGIEHFSSRRVVYDMHCFVTTNRDLLPDDVVSVFAKTSCTFGFATHLFSAELKAIAGE